MRSTSERAGSEKPNERATELEPSPTALIKIVRAVVQQATGLDTVRCSNCHNLTGCLDLRIVADEIVACSRCASDIVLALAQKRAFLTGEGLELDGEVRDAEVERMFEDLIDHGQDVVQGSDLW